MMGESEGKVAPPRGEGNYRLIRSVFALLLFGFSLGGCCVLFLFFPIIPGAVRAIGISFFLLVAGLSTVWRFSDLWFSRNRSITVKMLRHVSVLFDRFFIGFFNFNRKLRDKIILSYINWNNGRVKESFRFSIPKSILILLPRCIHDGACKQDVTADIELCKKCGLCPVRDILILKEKFNLPVKIAHESAIAYRYARELDPELTIAIACNDRLFKGITRVWKIASFCIPLLIGTDQCKNRSLSIKELEEILRMFWPEVKVDDRVQQGVRI